MFAINLLISIIFYIFGISNVFLLTLLFNLVNATTIVVTNVTTPRVDKTVINIIVSIYFYALNLLYGATNYYYFFVIILSIIP